jgi:hypothetical protein
MGADPPSTVNLLSGDLVTVVASPGSDVKRAEGLRRVEMVVAEVRGSGSATRSGYELAGDIEGGDSGAGLFAADGSLAGLAFAASTEREGIGWATAATVITEFLDTDRGAGRYQCDPDSSRVVRIDEGP